MPFPTLRPPARDAFIRLAESFCFVFALATCGVFAFDCYQLFSDSGSPDVIDVLALTVNFLCAAGIPILLFGRLRKLREGQFLFSRETVDVLFQCCALSLTLAVCGLYSPVGMAANDIEGCPPLFVNWFSSFTRGGAIDPVEVALFVVLVFGTATVARGVRLQEDVDDIL